MAQADIKPNIVPTKSEVAHGLFEMETPLFEVRHLVYSICMMGSSDQMPDKVGAAIDVVGHTVLKKVDELIEERHRLWDLAIGSSCQ